MPATRSSTSVLVVVVVVVLDVAVVVAIFDLFYRNDSRSIDDCTPCKMVFAVLQLCSAITVVSLAIRNVTW